MSKIPVSDNITSRYVQANGIQQHILEHGQDNAPTKILFIHGNLAAATWWEEIMLGLEATTYHSVAVDLRGYGNSETAPVDATRGFGDMVDDVDALITELGWHQFHIVGHSMGGSVTYAYMQAHPEKLQSVTLVAPGSPYGFGGTHGSDGKPNFEDFAGSGGGLANPELIRNIREQNRSTESDDNLAPINVMRNLFFKPPFIHPRETAILEAYIATALGEDNYPGTATPSSNWPGSAPGDRGVFNALSPKYDHGYKIIDIPAENKPPVCWVRGDADTIISNTSTSELGYLGQLGLIPGWPGADVFPPQPMIDQTRAVLETYTNTGGLYTEHILADCGHSPQAEKFDEFMQIFQPFVDEHNS